MYMTGDRVSRARFQKECLPRGSQTTYSFLDSESHSITSTTFCSSNPSEGLVHLQGNREMNSTTCWGAKMFATRNISVGCFLEMTICHKLKYHRKAFKNNLLSFTNSLCINTELVYCNQSDAKEYNWNFYP